jgi:hypothetical protein
MVELKGINLADFRRQKEAVAQAALVEISSRVETIRTLLGEIAELQEATGVEINLYDVRYKLSEIIATQEEDWNSSSC